MDEGDTNKDEKDSVKSSSLEVSPRGSIDGEKDGNRLLTGTESISVDEAKHEIKSDGSSDPVSLSKVSHTADEVVHVQNEGDSDSENPNETSNSIDEGDLDSKNLNKTSHAVDEVAPVQNNGDSDSENPNETSHSVDEVVPVQKKGDSDPENLNKTSHSIDVGAPVQNKGDLDSENPNRASHSMDEVASVQNKGDLGTKNPKEPSRHTDEVGSVQSEGDLESECQKDTSQTSDLADAGTGLDVASPNKASQTSEPVKGEDGNADSKTAEVLGEHDSASINLHENGHSANALLANKDINSKSEERKGGQHPNLEKPSEPDSENLIRKDILIEDELCLSNNVSEKVDEAIEVKEIDPVFDGTEASELEAVSGSSSQSVDIFPDSPSNTWPEKASALKNLVKMKGAFAVSNVLRRFSGGKEDPENPEEEEKAVIVERTVDEPVMLGRIILYTRLGCQESKEVRSLLHQKGLNVIEINVDVFPGRKFELEKKTGTSAVPRVYFNDLLVGGLSELKAMAESGKLDEHTNTLMHEEPSAEAPLPPFNGEDDVSATGKMDELASICRKMKESIILSDRFSKLRRFSNCFIGSEAVDFLSQDQELDREEAINIGRKLVKARFFRHVLDENIFEDGNHLYRFLEHDPIVSTNCYNMTRGINELKPKRITEIASRLRFLSFAMIEAYVSEDGRHVDYKSIQGCEEFRRYLRIIEELQRAEVDNISREEKLAFFVNLHNMMAIHAILTWGHPPGAADRKRFLGEFKYVVGGCPYSLSAIQNGVLRANQRPPYNISKPFGPKDMRFKVALPYMEPLVHFALVCGNRSGPPLKCYSPGNIDMELMESARNFLRNGGLIVDAEAKTASTSSIIRWYSADFGKNETEVMKHLSNYLEPSKTQDLLDLLANNQLKVTYQPYDWDLNS